MISQNMYTFFLVYSAAELIEDKKLEKDTELNDVLVGLKVERI